MSTPKSRNDRRARPSLEGLERRELFDAKQTLLRTGQPINDKDLNRLILQLQNRYPNGERIPAADRRIVYKTADGKTAVVNLYGKGTLKQPDAPSTVTNGVLDLVYNYTDNSSRIVGRVIGGGQAPISGIRDADTPARTSTATGANPVNAVILHSFALADNGYINLTGGVLELDLYSLGRNTQVHLKQGTAPPTTTSTTTATTSATSTVSANPGTATITTPGTAVVTTPGTTTAFVSDVAGTTTGSTTNSAAAIAASTLQQRQQAPPPEGIIVNLVKVNAGPLGTDIPGNPQIFGADPQGQKLVRFDTVTGLPTMTLDVPEISGTGSVGVGLSRLGLEQIVLVGQGQTVVAFDAVNGTRLGSFSTANIPASSLGSVTGIGGSEQQTILVGDAGAAVAIDVAASLASGQATLPTKPVPFEPTRDFTLGGGATGVSGAQALVVSGSGHFDTATPLDYELAAMALSATTGNFREAGRAALPSASGSFINQGPTPQPDPAGDLGSIESSIARVTGLVTDDKGVTRNVLTTYSSSTFGINGGRVLTYGNQLRGLSESFYPNIQGGALVDIQGVLRRLTAQTATGLVVNGRSTVNLVGIGSAIDTAIVGRPLDHVDIPARQNVTLLSTARGVNGKIERNGVMVEGSLPNPGPINLP